MGTPHKHAALIKAWADGAQIEMFCVIEGWRPCLEPSWHSRLEYRIKPEKKKCWVCILRDVRGRPYTHSFDSLQDYIMHSKNKSVFIKFLQEIEYEV